MHEMSLAENVLQIIEDAAQEQGFRHVSGVILEIGKLAAVEPDAMRFCFDAVMAGTLAEGACLEIIETPGQGRCIECGATVKMEEAYGLCHECGSPRLQVVAGDRMRVKSLEVD